MRRVLAASVLLLGGAWVAGEEPKPSSKKVVLKVIGPGSDFSGQVWGQATLPPMLSFRIRSGKAPDKGVVLCSVGNEAVPVVDHRIHTLVLRCEEGLVLELEGMDLAGGESR